MSAEITTTAAAVVYIFSGICQPLLMTVCKNAGLADSGAQLYMLFYYAGPSFLLLTLLPSSCCCCCCFCNRGADGGQQQQQQHQQKQLRQHGPSMTAVAKASLIACFDIAAQSLNYTGASLAGATVFALIYSSVTVWTAIFSRLVLGRELTRQQCGAILVVFCGLCITGLDNFNNNNPAGNSDVAHGTVLVFLGSCMHGATYVMSEAIMSKSGTTAAGGDDGTSSATQLETNSNDDDDGNGSSKARELLSVRENAAIQGVVACSGLLVWQMVYTLPRWDALIRQPVRAAGTTWPQAAFILVSFGLANLLHSLSFYHTLAHYPGGSTSAGVMKGLQAVLVFVAAHLLYCNNASTNNSNKNTDMCFSTPKFLSLVTVVGGVVLFSNASTGKSAITRGAAAGYTRIASDAVVHYEGPV